ncbi:MAG: SMC-Scp complex subunit ScpB [Spiroplasma sp. WSS]|uniref:SMC-Scp complex subunit ScpB n=1 Tax=unclassified Spiroplasma TaxID=2637901 RepID=UPI0012183323|nr:SMC-Scp complex subunit ScpB [Spiroplasma endosymbiont of Lariophagus distinguendus]TLF25549.1 MAG: SMC-Scp complex subunit ScpB [Spiroplasma sp. WSS]
MNNSNWKTNERLAVLQGLLFIAGNEGLDLLTLAEYLELTKKPKTVENLIVSLQMKLNDDDTSGLSLIKVGNIYKLTTKPIHYNRYQVLKQQPLIRLSQAALETLAIIAYNHPVTKPQIEDIRGVNCDSIIFKLKSLNLITEIGRSELPGKPILYDLTDEFMDHFNIESLTQLPTLPQFNNQNDEQEIYNFTNE